MLRQTIYLILIALLCITANAYAHQHWQTVSPGIEYLKLTGNGLAPWSFIHVFRVDLHQNTLDLVSANELNRPYATAKEFAEHSKGLITINAGFFDQNFKPIGLRIAHKKQGSPFKTISWWGVFYIAHKHPALVSARAFKADPQISFAIQSGPRLLVDNQIMPLKPGIAERTALGITADQRVILLVTENSALSTHKLATVMQSSPIDCTDALNLDGGSSSQLYAKMDTFLTHVRGFSSVSDAIIVRGK